MDKRDNKRVKKHRAFNIVIGIVLTIVFVFLSLHSATFLVENPNANILESIVYGIHHAITLPAKILPPSGGRWWSGFIPHAAVLFAAVLWLILDDIRHRHYDPDEACGTAQWNNNIKKYNEKYTYPIGSKITDMGPGNDNMILTKNVALSLNGEKTKMNCNVLVNGDAGSGKSRYFVKPNILQANSNYVVTDPSGELCASTARFLEEKEGYEIKVFNLVDFDKSNCYNPFCYIRDETGVFSMIKCLIKNTNPPGKNGGDPFWEKSEELLLGALCLYLWKHDKAHANFSHVLDLILKAQVDENPSPGQPLKQDGLDKIFYEVEKRDPTDIAVRQYKMFKQGAGKTLKSILISCSVRLQNFNLPQIKRLTDTDNIKLEELGSSKKQALFVIIPTADITYSFLAAMMYTQLFDTLYYIAGSKVGAKKTLDRDVRFLLDEFANIANLPDFDKRLATMRKYRISCAIILQSLSQLEAMYKDEWQSIISNCNSFLFLGGQEEKTAKYVSEMLGDQTIVVRDRSLSNGKSKSDSQSYKTQSRKLLNIDEVRALKPTKCVLMQRGLDPFLDDKYDYLQHPNYKYTADYDNTRWTYEIKQNVGVNETSTQSSISTFDEIRQKTAELNIPKSKSMSIDEMKNEQDIKDVCDANTSISTNPQDEFYYIQDYIVWPELSVSSSSIPEKKQEDIEIEIQNAFI